MAEEEGEFAIQEQLTESEKLIKECTMSWEQKEKQTEQIQQVQLAKITLPLSWNSTLNHKYAPTLNNV